MAGSAPQFVFDDPRFGMSVGGRFLVRAGAVTGYILLLAAFAAALLSNVVWLRWLGVFLGLILADRFVHRQDGDVPIPDLLRRSRINIAQALAPGLVSRLERAFDNALVSRTSLAPEIGMVLLKDKSIQAGLRRLDLDPAEVAAKLSDFLKRDDARSEATRVERLNELHGAVAAAFENAATNGHRFINATDVFASLPSATEGPNLMTRLFTVFDIDPGDLERAFIFTSAGSHRGLFGGMPSLSGLILPTARTQRHRIMNRAWTARTTPTLDAFSDDLSDAARMGGAGFLIGHGAEYEHMLTALARETNPNVMLVGQEGVGKETLIGHLAFQIQKDKVPSALFDKRLVALDIPRLVAGGSPEELQARLQAVAREIVIAGNVILVLNDIHNLAKTSGAAYVSAADALLPILRNNAFPVLGTTFPKEYRELIEPRSDFSGNFETVEVKEISADDAERILVYQAILLEAEHRVKVSFGAVKSAVRLAQKYFRNLPLPGSAITLLKSAATLGVGQGQKTITHEDVVHAAESRINVPLHETTKEEGAALLRLEETIRTRPIGQEEAVKAVADALRAYRSGLARTGGPIASFLFVGPTGVGKTELAKTLAAIQFGSDKTMMRFDMTEYKETGSIARFIGTPDGRVPGALTEAVKKQPYGLILLDEFEKAAPDILDLFLQVLDDGRLTDASGMTLSFENTIIIATSNAHSDLINEALKKGESVASIADYLKSRLTDVLKPELLNRFSKVIIFHDLNPADMGKIAALEMKKLAGVLDEQGFTLNYGPEVVTQMAKWGYDPQFGARPLRRAIDEHLRAPLANWLLAQAPPRGAEIKVALNGEAIGFSV